MNPSKINILWAVDPFEESNPSRPHVVATLKSLSRKGRATVTPVYVLSPGDSALSVGFSGKWVHDLVPATEKSLRSLGRKLKIPGTRPPKVLVEELAATGDSVRRLARYAKTSGADLIVLSTHARQGLPRFFLGSFAETLLLNSQVPVLVVGPTSKEGLPGNILFATDFGKASHQMFRRVTALARVLSAKVTLFHALPATLEPVFQSGVYLLGGGWIPSRGLLDEREDNHRKLAERWAAEASEAGVQVSYVADLDYPGVTQAILKCAKGRRASMIAMAAESGTVSAALIGSITRQVVRHAPCPVWVMRK